MEYPKPLMSITELNKLGYPRDFLERIVHHKNSSLFTRRTSPQGKYLIDTYEFEKAMRTGKVK